MGDSAILLGIKQLVSRVNSTTDAYYIAALSTDVDYTATHGVTGVPALLKSDLVKPWRWLALAREFKKADLIVVSGGTPIFDYSHLVRTAYFALPILLRKPFIFFGIGVKPIESWYGRWYIHAALNRATHVSVRDRGSKVILEELGVRNVVLTADSAFFAERGADADLDALLDRHGIGRDERIFVVAPRLMSNERKALYLDREMDPELVRTATSALAEAIDELAPEFDRVVLAAMHYYGRDSDIPLCRALLDETRAPNIILIAEELRPELAISLLDRGEVVLAMRLHAALLAASMSSPVVAIAYEQKVTDLLERLDLQHYCIDLFTMDSRTLVDRVREALERAGEIEASLNRRTQHLRDLILEQATNYLRINVDAN